MKTPNTTPMGAYRAPVVADGGEAKSVTLGKNGFDVQDKTEYRQKTPGRA
ncbi:hypothetical protein [Embleya sp. NPDC059237]